MPSKKAQDFSVCNPLLVGIGQEQGFEITKSMMKRGVLIHAVYTHHFTDLQLHQETAGAQIEQVLGALVPAAHAVDQNME
jgi:hypothetical protein